MDLPHVTDDVLESAFLKGLKKNLWDQVVRCRPMNMYDILEITRLIEAQECDNTSYQVRSGVRLSQPQASGGGSRSDQRQ